MNALFEVGDRDLVGCGFVGAGDRLKGTTGGGDGRRLAPTCGRLEGRFGTELDNRRLMAQKGCEFAPM